MQRCSYRHFLKIWPLLQFKTFAVPFLLRVCLMPGCQAGADRQKVLHREVSVITPHRKRLSVAREAVSSSRKICALWGRSRWVTIRNKTVTLKDRMTEGSRLFLFFFFKHSRIEKSRGRKLQEKHLQQSQEREHFWTLLFPFFFFFVEFLDTGRRKS